MRKIGLEDLVQAGEHHVLRMFARHVPPTEARELLQDTLVRAYVAIQRGQHPDEPTAWLMGIARYVLFEHLRRRDTQQRLEQRLAVLQRYGWEIDDQDTTDNRLVVASALDELPNDLREPVLLYYYAGLSIADIAAHMSLTRGAVKMRLQRARHTLRHVLADLDERRPSVTQPDLVASTRDRAEHAPLYDTLAVALRVGTYGTWTTPWWPSQRPRPLTPQDMQVAIQHLHQARIAYTRPLAPTLTTDQLSPGVFDAYEPLAIWQLATGGDDGYPAGHTSRASIVLGTNGWRIATDPNWRPLLEQFRDNGLASLYFQFHGLEDIHDEMVGRPGAYESAVLAIQRTQHVGLAWAASIVISTRNIHEIDKLHARLQGLAGEMPPAAAPAPRGMRGVLQVNVAPWGNPAYEPIRPEPEDLANIRLQLRIGGYPDFTPPTEAGLTQQTIDQPPPAVANLYGCQILVDGSLDAYASPYWAQSPHLDADVQSLPFHHIGNLGAQTLATTYERIAQLPALPTLPSDAELARRYGDTTSRKVHSSIAISLRRKWIAAWRHEHNI